MSSRRFAVPPADGDWGLSGPDTKSSPPAKSIRGGASNTQDDSPMFAFMATSPASAPGSSPATACRPSSSSPARRRAKTPAPPTPGDAASTASAPGSSSPPSDLQRISDAIGCCLRTSLASWLAESTGFSLSWELKATPRGYSMWALSTPAPRIGESGSGLLPTALKGDSRMRGYMRDRGQIGRERPTLVGILRGLMPTAVKSEFGGGYNQGGGSGRIGPKRPRLTALLKGMLPTAAARDWRSGKASAATHGRNSRPLNETLERISAGAPIAGTAVCLHFIEWHMGFPAGWLKPASPPMATRSCRSSPKPGAAPSPRPKRSSAASSKSNG